MATRKMPAKTTPEQGIRPRSATSATSARPAQYRVQFYSESGLDDFKRRAQLREGDEVKTENSAASRPQSPADFGVTDEVQTSENPNACKDFGSDFTHQRRINASVLRRNALDPSLDGGVLEEKKTFLYDPHLGCWQRYRVSTVRDSVKAPSTIPQRIVEEPKVVEKIVHVPQIVEKIVEVPKIVEKIVEVPKEKIVYRDRIVYKEEEEEVLVHDIRTVMIKREVKETFTEMETRMVAIQVPVVKERTKVIDEPHQISIPRTELRKKQHEPQVIERIVHVPTETIVYRDRIVYEDTDPPSHPSSAHPSGEHVQQLKAEPQLQCWICNDAPAVKTITLESLGRQVEVCTACPRAKELPRPTPQMQPSFQDAQAIYIPQERAPTPHFYLSSDVLHYYPLSSMSYLPQEPLPAAAPTIAPNHFPNSSVSYLPQVRSPTPHPYANHYMPNGTYDASRPSELRADSRYQYATGS